MTICFFKFPFTPSAMNALKNHLLHMKKAGLVLLVIGLLDIGWMIVAIANQKSYASSLNVFAVAAGVLLIRGSLRVASLVRWLSLFAGSAMVSLSVVSPVLFPWGLVVAYAQVYPFVLLGFLAFFIAFIALFGWLFWQLNTEPMRVAQQAMGRKRRDARVPLLAGVALAGVLAVSRVVAQRSDAAKRAVSEARGAIGGDHEFHLTSISYRSGSGITVVSGVVIAWKTGSVRSMPFEWRE